MWNDCLGVCAGTRAIEGGAAGRDTRSGPSGAAGKRLAHTQTLMDSENKAFAHTTQHITSTTSSALCLQSAVSLYG